MVFTAFQLGQTSSAAPDVDKANVSAARIKALLNPTDAESSRRTRLRPISVDADSLVVPGLKPVCTAEATTCRA